MDDFNDFFNEPNNDQEPELEPVKTPIYHTPEPEKKNNKQSTIMAICIAISVIMCVVVIINVIVLYSLKTKIADEYSTSIAQTVNDKYTQAIDNVLDNTDIVEDIKDSATDEVVKAMSTDIGKIADTKCAPSVARIFMYESTTSSSYAGLATAFLITNSTATSTERYLITNAHCARYLKKVYTTYEGGYRYGQQILTGYEWASYGKVVGYFENDTTPYTMQIVAYGAYDPGSDYSYYYGITKENDQADFAILKITGTQPSNESHPALKLTTGTRGSDIAIIGNPEGIGSTNSIAIGTISQTGITISSWGAGSFLMTDAAINGGNSGGPVIDYNGNVVGVVESKLVSTDIENMGFALETSSLVSFLTWAQTKYALTINYTII